MCLEKYARGINFPKKDLMKNIVINLRRDKGRESEGVALVKEGLEEAWLS